MARKKFVDSLRMQAADSYLTTRPRTRLKLITPTLVAEMTPTQLGGVAGENLALKGRRLQLEKEHENLEDGKNILG